MVPFSTAGLELRRPEAADVEPLMAMDADPEVMRYIGAGTVIQPDRDRALRAVRRWRDQWDEQGFGMCSVIVRETGEYVGWVTLAVPNFLPEILPAVEIGWRLRRDCWGQGYATEAAAELLRFGLTEAGLDRLVSIRDVANTRSQRVMDKLGLRFEFHTTVPATGQSVAVHAITRPNPGAHEVHSNVAERRCRDGSTKFPRS
jgi:RimJ/RimL family protein N-acetyltransferase